MSDRAWLQEFLTENLDDPDYLSARVVVSLNQQIYRQMNLLEINQRDLAIKAGFRPEYLNRQLRHGGNLTIRTIVRIAKALNMELSDALLKPIENTDSLSWSVPNRSKAIPPQKVIESQTDFDFTKHFESSEIERGDDSQLANAA